VPQKSLKRERKEVSGHSGYRIPFLNIGIPDSLVEIGFYSTLAVTAAMGTIDPPLAALIGIGVLIAKHRRDNFSQ
jgi:hypothetical protein